MSIYKDIFGRFYTYNKQTAARFRVLNQEYDKMMMLKDKGYNIYPQQYVNFYVYDKNLKRYFLPPSLKNSSFFSGLTIRARFPEIKLRPWQEKVLKEIQKYNSVIVRAPTGA